ncbi:MAG: DUF397 domain-containing protein [Streptosporangiaceae bacterium]|jgi:Domain of unknown function (DUF397)
MWVKSSYSYACGNCVEVQREDSSVSVRDGKDPSGPVLTFTENRWKAFIAGCRAGEFDTGA